MNNLVNNSNQLQTKPTVYNFLHEMSWLQTYQINVRSLDAKTLLPELITDAVKLVLAAFCKVFAA